MIEALSADLADRGFSVSCFANGPSFLEAMSNGLEAQVALLDWGLPQMSGFELLGAIRERGIELPVVFLTGYSLVERELQALDRGAVDFVDKAHGVVERSDFDIKARNMIEISLSQLPHQRMH